MRLFVNGVEVPFTPAEGLRVELRLGGDEEMGPVCVRVRGGRLTVNGDELQKVAFFLDLDPEAAACGEALRLLGRSTLPASGAVK